MADIFNKNRGFGGGNAGPRELLIATGNGGKVKEYRELLADLPFRIIDLKGIGRPLKEIEESGDTFRENALLKAKGYARSANLMTLADDSGLEVRALGGAPGVRSARYGGLGATQDRKNDLLLEALDRAETSDRSARFVCVAMLAAPDGSVIAEAEGIVDGSIAQFPRGSGGFGYDPLFIPNGFDETFGELGSDIKQQISHRARAFAVIRRFLRGLT
jgi:XTP/dITP diphosphohydrolase